MTTLDRVKRVIAKQLEVDEDQLSPATGWNDLPPHDSLERMELMMALEEEFGIEIPDEAAQQFQTVGEIVAGVEARLGALR